MPNHLNIYAQLVSLSGLGILGENSATR